VVDQVAFLPCGSAESLEHYEQTVQQPVLLSEIKGLLPAAMFDHLGALFPGGQAAMWGVRSGARGENETRWGNLREGSIALFAGGWKVFASGVVAAKFRSKKVADHLWGANDDGQPWQFMFALAEIREHDLPTETLKAAIGDKPGQPVLGFRVLDESRSRVCLDEFGLRSERDVWPPGPADIDAAIRALDKLEADYLARRRLEQDALRSFLLGGRGVGRCKICEREYGAGFLVAAHIKMRAKCTNTEKRDFRNVAMLACKFGCDELYERGYIGYSPTGDLLVSRALRDANATAYVAGIPKRIVLSAEQAKYFAWHLANRFKG